MLKKIILLIFITLLTVNAQSNLKVVRLDACSEAWLAADRQKALDILSTREAEGDHQVITLYNLGYLYFLQGNYDKAIMYFHIGSKIMHQIRSYWFRCQTGLE